MSLMNQLVTSDVTIDLDFDENDYPTADKDICNQQNEDNEFVIEMPIPLNKVLIDIDNSILVNNLADVIKDTISLNLDVPPYVSIASWIDVSNYFKIDSTDQLRIESQPKPGEELMAVIGEYPASELFKALALSERIDILLLVKKIIKARGFLNSKKDQYLQITRKLATDSSHYDANEISNATNVILVNHFEKTDIERKNYKWFMKNLRRNLKMTTNCDLKIVDIDELEQNDRGNIIETIHEFYAKARHIIVCYNESYLNILKTTDMDPSFNYRKYIHQQTMSDFFANGMRNRRCRCVLMPGITTAEGMGWSSVTYQYSFPDGFEQLLERLNRQDVNNMKTL